LIKNTKISLTKIAMVSRYIPKPLLILTKVCGIFAVKFCILLTAPHTPRFSRKLAAVLLSVLFIQVLSGWGFVLHQWQHHSIQITSETSHAGCAHSHHLTNEPGISDGETPAYSVPEYQCVYCLLQWFPAPHVIHNVATLGITAIECSRGFAVFGSHQQLALQLPGDRAPPVG